jgi:AraC-like DNA-binding protein
MRLGTAIVDLNDTNKSMLDIALDSGFPNIKSFNRAFKEMYKKKPSEYRKMIPSIKGSDVKTTFFGKDIISNPPLHLIDDRPVPEIEEKLREFAAGVSL